MDTPLHPRMRTIEPLVDVLCWAARETLLKAAKYMDRKPAGAYRTLVSGQDTPLWNELRERVAGHVAARGEKVRLARYLGVPRQRVHLMIKAGSAIPDAERTLLLLAWVVARERGGSLS